MKWFKECGWYTGSSRLLYISFRVFCPINVTTGRIHVEKNTRTIHHYAGTWVDKKFSMKEIVKQIIPEKLLLALFTMKAKLKNK